MQQAAYSGGREGSERVIDRRHLLVFILPMILCIFAFAISEEVMAVISRDAGHFVTGAVLAGCGLAFILAYRNLSLAAELRERTMVVITIMFYLLPVVCALVLPELYVAYLLSPAVGMLLIAPFLGKDTMRLVAGLGWLTAVGLGGMYWWTFRDTGLFSGLYEAIFTEAVAVAAFSVVTFTIYSTHASYREGLARAAADPVTDGPSARVLDRHLERMEAAGRRAEVVAFRINGLSRINSLYGLEEGHKLLRSVFVRLQGYVPGTEWSLVARRNVEEFVMVCERTLSASELTRRAELIRREIFDNPFSLRDGIHVRLCVSAGTSSSCERPSEDVEMAVRALGQSSGAYSREVISFSPEEVEAERREMALQNALGREVPAGGYGAFELRYRPLADLRTDAICGLVATPFWASPSGEEVSGAHLWRMLEYNPALGKVARELVERALGCFPAFRALDPLADLRPFTLVMKLPPAALAGENGGEWLGESLSGAAVEPENIELWLEADRLGDLPTEGGALQGLSASGVGLGVCGFGGSSADLSLMSRGVFSTVSISGRLMGRTGLLEPDEAEELVLASAFATRHMGLRSACEGIHGHNQLEFARFTGIERATGTLMGEFAGHEAALENIKYYGEEYLWQ